jgi:hypothetical protein
MSRGQRKKGARLKLNLDKIQRFQKLHRTWVSIGTSASWALGSFYEAFAPLPLLLLDDTPLPEWPCKGPVTSQARQSHPRDSQ